MLLTAEAPPTTVGSMDQEADYRDWIALLKPRVLSLVVFTGAIGLMVAPGHVNPVLGLTAIPFGLPPMAMVVPDSVVVLIALTLPEPASEPVPANPAPMFFAPAVRRGPEAEFDPYDWPTEQQLDDFATRRRAAQSDS